MKPSELAAEVSEIVGRAQARIKGVGAEQYHDAGTDTQKFETMRLDGLIEYLEEELLDQINYGVMGLIRLRRLAPLIGRLELLAAAEEMYAAWTAYRVWCDTPVHASVFDNEDNMRGLRLQQRWKDAVAAYGRAREAANDHDRGGK